MDGRWRSEADLDNRTTQFDRMLVTLMACFPNCASVDSDELVKMAKWLEEDTYADATSYTDYLHRLYVKHLRLESRFQTTAVLNQGQQLLYQNVPNTIVSAGAQTASFLPALPSMTSLTQTSGPSPAGLFNMQSGITQDFFDSSASQGLPSNIFSNTQWQMPEWDQLEQFSSQEQQMLMEQNLLQPTQMSNAVGRSTNTQSEIAYAQYLFQQQQQQEQEHQLEPLMKQNLLKPTRMSNAVGLSTNKQSEIAHAQDLIQQQQHQPFSSSMNSNAQTGQNADDWKEEIYQKIKAMKQNYLPYLNEIHQKTLKDFQQLKGNVSVSNVPKYERQKLLDLLDLLEDHMRILNVSKDNIVPGMKGNLSKYEKQVMHVIKSNWPREPVSAQQQIQQPGGHPLSTQPPQQQQQQPQPQPQPQPQRQSQPHQQQSQPQPQPQQQQSLPQQQQQTDNQPDATHQIIDVITDSE